MLIRFINLLAAISRVHNYASIVRDVCTNDMVTLSNRSSCVSNISCLFLRIYFRTCCGNIDISISRFTAFGNSNTFSMCTAVWEFAQQNKYNGGTFWGHFLIYRQPIIDWFLRWWILANESRVGGTEEFFCRNQRQSLQHWHVTRVSSYRMFTPLTRRRELLKRCDSIILPVINRTWTCEQEE